MKPTALFRLEFGGRSGWGHLVRSGALALELRRRGWSCILWTASDVKSVPRDLCAPFQRVIGFDTGSGEIPQADGVLVVDHYGTTDAQLRAWRTGFSGRILVLDDEGHRKLDAADLVLNPRLGLSVSPYAPGVRPLLGERFALLRPGLREPIPPELLPDPETIAVLVIMGGTDPAGMTAVALDALADVDELRVTPIVVRPGVKQPVGPDDQALRRFRRAVWLDAVNASELAGWARVCRLAVSAAGGTLYELAALRLPFVQVAVADNQRAFAGEVEARWGMPCVQAGGRARDALAIAIRDILARVDRGDDSLSVPFAAIDGRGAERVADALAR